MHFRRSLALSAVMLGSACEMPVNTGPSTNVDLGVVSVAIQPKTAAVLVGDSLQLSASVLMSNSRPPNSVSWASSNTSLATVTSGGMVHGLAAGSLFIRATSGSKRDSAALTIAAPSPLPVAAVTVAPTTGTVSIGSTLQLTAALRDGNGNLLTGRTVTWASGSPGVATVTGTGLVTGVGVGSATITATSEGQSGAVTVSVTAVPVASVVVTPATATVQTGQTVQLSASTKDANGGTLTGRVVTWATSNALVATVTSGGLVSGLAAGSATITASSEGQSGTATVSITAVPVASVVVTPATTTVQAGQTAQLSATTKDANGGTLTGRAVTWATSNALVATVTSGGVVTGVAAGSATITATSEGQRGTGTVSVTAVPVASVIVAPATATVQAGQTVQLAATTKDANGGTLTGRVVTWATSNALVATVSGGVVSGVVAGSATITATSEGQSSTATISVTAPPPSGSGTVYFNSTFEDGTLGNLSVYQGSTGTCTVTSAVARTGSRSAKCTTTGGAADEAALWYTWGNKAGEPANPALSEANGYYQKFSVMFAPGSFANVYNGGSTAQFKLLLNRSDWHYGFEGEWFMSSWGVNYGSYPPLLANNGDNCSGMHWNWPAVLQEGVWYDITTWFKRDPTTHTGHAKMWVNGVLITDTDVMPPVWGTSASPGGYSCFGSDNAADQQQLEVGATYTLNTVGPFTVYVDDVEAANFPIGAAAAAPANLAKRVSFGGR